MTYWGVDIEVYTLLIFLREGQLWLPLRPSRPIPGERSQVPLTQYTLWALHSCCRLWWTEDILFLPKMEFWFAGCPTRIVVAV